MMLDAAIDGSFSETTFDESKLSALETKFAHYLSAAETSSRNLAREKDKIKALVADISHQTKTPIANLLLYSELLQEEALPPSTEANVDTLHAQAKKLQFLIDALVKLSRLENGIISLSPKRTALQPLLQSAAEQYAAKAAEKAEPAKAEAPAEEKPAAEKPKRTRKPKAEAAPAAEAAPEKPARKPRAKKAAEPKASEK